MLLPEYSYGINNCIVDDSVLEILLNEACEKYLSMDIRKSLKFFARSME